MKLIKLSLVLIFLLFVGKHAYSQSILLPVEVLGEEGKTVTRTFNLTVQEATNSVKLWLQVNNLGYENKASIKINNGTWLDLNHATVDMQAQEKARGGMVHGGFNTIRFSIPATDIAAGSNTIYFRFNTSDAISNGYRVVRFNLLDANSNKILSPTRFIEDNPEDWVAPFTDAQSIAEGKDLWYNAPLISNYLPAGRKGFWYAHEIGSAKPIQAKCSSCHAQDGRDLEIFSYSNDAIVERSKFHHLSEVDGQKIASYIRSLSDEHENVGRYGRPWNPPYQPGPALDTLPIEQWAAGAGLDAVLDEDKDMLPYLFPNGVDQEKVYDRFDSDKSFDRTIIPLSIQFPDWKHWLPMVHPMDAYNKNNYYLDPNTGPNNPNKNYYEVREYLEQNAPLGFPNKTELANKVKTLHNHHRFFVQQGGSENEHWRTADGDATKNLYDDVAREFAATSLARLYAVKNFEIVQEFDLQDKAAEFGNPADQFQVRQWFGDEYNVFEVPPHFQGCVDNNCNQFMGQPTETGMYESTVWYQLQMVINGGDGQMSHNSPVDYNYHPDFITKACNSSGINEPLRYYHSMNVMYQTKTWSGGGSPNSGNGFRIRVMGPWNIYGISDGNQFNGFEPGEFARSLENVKPGMTAWVMNAMLRQFLTEVQKDHNRLSIWNRTENGSANALDRADKTFADIQDALQRTENKNTFFYHYAAKFYYYIPRFQKLGVDCQIMEELIDWCQEAWPLIDWHVFSNKSEMQLSLVLEDDNFCSTSSSLTAISTNTDENTVFNWTVNGNPIGGNGNSLSTENLEQGDVVNCSISNNATCLINNTANASSIISPINYNFSMRRSGTNDFTPIESIVACTNEELELKLDIDIQPKQWLDAMNVNNGNEPTDNSEIDTWYDQSGNGFIAEANQAGLRPKYRSDAMNGLPAVFFGDNNNADGLELFSTNEDDFMNNDWTIVLVGKTQTNGNTDWRDLIGNKTEGENGWFYRFNGNGARVQVGIGLDLEHGQQYNFDRSFVAQISKKGDVITTYLNGTKDRVITKAQNVSMTINDALYLGQSSNGNPNTNRYHVGPISELMVFEHSLSEAEQLKIEGYLTHKWKLNNELTYTHPFADHSPFSFDMSTANGESLTFDPIETNHTLNFNGVNNFGDYKILKNGCSTFNTSVLPSPIQYFDDCDALTGWNNNVVLNTNDHQEGSGCLEFSGINTPEFFKSFDQPYNPGITASNGVLKFRYYISDVSQIETWGQVEIGSAGQFDVNEYHWTLQNITNGWNEVTLNISGASITGGAPNLNTIDWFRIYNFKTDNVITRIDEISLSSNVPTSVIGNLEPVVIDSFTVSNDGSTLTNVIQYSINGSSETTGNALNVLEGDELILSPEFTFSRDYQWERPDNNTFPINTNPDFTALKTVHDGMWKLHILPNDCISAGQMFEFTLTVEDLITGSDDLYSSELNLYPNPANDQLNIIGKGIIENAEVSILNIYGEVVLHESLTSSDKKINISTLGNGSYILLLKSKNENYRLKFTKVK